MMRPLVLISGLAPGGAERVTVTFVSRLARLGRLVPLCTVTSRHDGPLASELAEARVPRHDLGARRLADPNAAARLVRLLLRHRVDVIHAHGQDASILAAAAASVTGTRLVVTRHVLEEPTETRRQRLRARAALAAFRRADAPIAVSRAAAARVAELASMPAGRVRVIPNGIDLERYGRPELEAGRADTRRAIGVEPNAPVVLVPAVLRPGKGHDALLGIAPALAARVPGVRILLAGDGPLASRLQDYAEAAGDAVRFLGEREDMPALFAACDVVALPSLAEALPTALMEAAAAGRAAVATDVGGTAEVVRDGETGLLVPPGSAARLTDALVSLLADRDRAREMGERARRHAARHFSIDSQVRRTLAVWAGITAERVA